MSDLPSLWALDIASFLNLPLWMWGVAGAALFAVAVLLLLRRLRSRRTAAFGMRLFQNGPDALLVLDRELRITHANAAAARLLGGQALTGRRLARVVQMDAPPPEEALPAHAGAAPWTADVTAPGKENAARTLRLHLGAAHDEHDDEAPAPQYLAALRDVTDERRAQRRFQAFHRRTLNELPIEAAVLSPEGKFIYTNPRMAPGEAARNWLQGKTDFDLCGRLGLHPEIALRRRAHRQRARITQERVRFEESIPLPSGETAHYTRYYVPVLQEDGEPYAFVWYGVDDSALQGAQEELEALRTDSESFDRLKASFFEKLGHELRTPLASIVGAAQVLQDELDEVQGELADIIDHNGRRLMDTLNTMIDLSQLEAEGIEAHPRVLDLTAEAEAMADEHRATAEDKDLFLRVQGPNRPALVWQDRACLHRVLENLISNAIKFTEMGGIVVEINVDGGAVVARLIDTGVGINEEYMPRLFEAFDQESVGLSRDFEGVGVGLAVTKRLLRQMGGVLSVDSQKGEGSIFTIAFPEAMRVERGAGTSVPPRVLVAEQNAEEQRLIRHILDPHTELAMAADLEAARAAAGEHPFDVMVLDADLCSDEASDDVLAHLRGLPGCQEVPIVVIDTNVLPGGAEQYLTAGYDRYVSKPLSKDTLLNAVAGVIVERSAPTLETIPLNGTAPAQRQPVSA